MKLIRFDTHIGQLAYLLNVNYIYVPAHIVKKLGGLKCGRLICHINNNLSFQCGLMSLGEGAAYITLNKARMKKLGLKEADELSVTLEKDTSVYGMELPEELNTLFEQDHIGKERFDALKPGMQRYIIYYVSQVKSSQLKIERAILLIGNLKKLSPGKETFKAMLGK